MQTKSVFVTHICIPNKIFVIHNNEVDIYLLSKTLLQPFGRTMILCVVEHGMEWVTQSYPKAIPTIFSFYYDNFIEPYWVHSMVEIFPGFTNEAKKRHHSNSSSRSGYMSVCKDKYDIKFLTNAARRIFHTTKYLKQVVNSKFKVI